MTRSTNEISIEEVLRQLGRMSEDGPSGSSSQDAALNSLLSSIANNSIASQTYGIPMNTGSRGPVDASGLLTMSEAQANQILQQRASERGMEILPGDVVGPTEELGVEDSIFQILYDTIIGEQGIPEGVSAEAIEAIRGDFGPTAAPEQLREIAGQIAEAGGFDQWLEQQDEVVLGDPGQIDEDTTQSPVETVFEEDGTITTIIDPTLITLPPLLGDPTIEDEEGGGGATTSPEQEGTPQPTEPTIEPTIPDYSDIVNPEFEVPSMPVEGEIGIPDFYEVDEEGNVTVILDPDNPVSVPPNRVPDHVDTETPGTYPESGVVSNEQEETTAPSPTGPNIVITPTIPAPAPVPVPTQPTDVVTEEPAGTETPSDTVDTGTDQAGQEGQEGTDTGGTGGGQAGNGGDGTGDGDGSGDGMLTSQKENDFLKFMAQTGYQPVAVPGMVTSPTPAAIPTINSNTALNSLFARLLA